jgi:hypothetical protein
MLPRESDIFGVPQTVDIMAVMDDGRWYSRPALQRSTGYDKSRVAGLLQRMMKRGWVEQADNPQGSTDRRSGVALWLSGPTAKGPKWDWPRGTPRRLYRVTGYGRRQADRARLWAALDLPWLWWGPGRPGAISWRRGELYRAIGGALAAKGRSQRRRGRG